MGAEIIIPTIQEAKKYLKSKLSFPIRTKRGKYDHKSGLDGSTYYGFYANGEKEENRYFIGSYDSNMKRLCLYFNL